MSEQQGKRTFENCAGTRPKLLCVQKKVQNRYVLGWLCLKKKMKSMRLSLGDEHRQLRLLDAPSVGNSVR